MTTLKEAGLYQKAEKCEFHQQEVKYLGLIVGVNGIRMDPEKVTAVKEWEAPSKLKEVQAFLGFANFYRRFIRNYSRVVQSLTKLTKKLVPFHWGPDQKRAFAELKEAFTTAPVLAHFDYEKEIVLETDASSYVSAGVLSQYDNQGILHPVAFFSKKHIPAEENYEIYDQELGAIVKSLEQWRPECEGSAHPIKILTDHKNLEYFMTSKLLNRRQTRWSEFLSRFKFKIVYRPGKQGQKPDALTRMPGDIPPKGGAEKTQQIVLKTENLDKRIQQGLVVAFAEVVNQDKTDPKELWSWIQNVCKDCPLDSSEGLCTNARVTSNNEDSDKLRLIKEHHDSPPAGHPGRAKTLELLKRNHQWPGMRKDVDRYVCNCHTCQRSKATHQKIHRWLKPLEIPQQPWKDLSMDFVVGLPESEGYNAIWVVVDRLSKMKHLVPCRDDTDGKKLGEMFIREVFKLHGLPDSIVSDRGPQFASEFWRHVCERLGIE